MTDLELRRALADAAGWEWVVDEPELTGIPHIDEIYGDPQPDYAYDEKHKLSRLVASEPLLFDDLIAACKDIAARHGPFEIPLGRVDWWNTTERELAERILAAVRERGQADAT